MPDRNKNKKPSGLAMKKLLASKGWRLYGSGGVMCALAAVFLIAGLILDNHWTASLKNLEADLQAEVALAELEVKQQQEADETSDVSAEPVETINDYDLEMQSRRRVTDDRTIADMISHATTWDSRLAYETSRKELLSHYSWLTAETNPEFLLSFFAPPEDLYNKLDDMILSDPLSDGRNITFGSITTYLLSENSDGVRTYFAEASTQSRGQVGGTYDAVLSMTYETRFDGSVWNLKCYSM